MDEKRFPSKSLEEELYIAGLIAMPIAVAVGIVFFVLIYPHIQMRCVIHAMTGLYCPGCGGTRAVYELLHGRLLKSLWYHPFVGYSVVLYVVYMGSHTLAKLFPGVKGIRFRPWYLYGALGVIVINCIIKNFLLWRFGIRL